ncbi:hypothetical protein DVH26_00965 [Paenibacillus sp. H1-7]|nr:hypothetical protein DVH26_00965 [Paenibacillus sp. H1-7]
MEAYQHENRFSLTGRAVFCHGRKKRRTAGSFAENIGMKVAAAAHITTKQFMGKQPAPEEEQA